MRHLRSRIFAWGLAGVCAPALWADTPATLPIETRPAAATQPAATQPALAAVGNTSPETAPTMPMSAMPTTRAVALSTTQPTAPSLPTTQASLRSDRREQSRSAAVADASNHSPSSIATAAASLQPKPFPRDYSLLTQRSIFEKGRLITDAMAGGLHSTQDKPAREPGEGTGGARLVAGLPADSLIFNGVTQTADSLFAFIEDTGSNSIALVRQGDALAGGKVLSITFDNLELSIAGATRNVQIGQTLTGKTAPAPSGDPSSTQPGSAAASSGSSADDAVLERMRKRREAETGGK